MLHNVQAGIARATGLLSVIAFPSLTSQVLIAWLCTGRVGGYTAAQVEEVRMVMRMLPIFFTTILFWTIYCQASCLIRACPMALTVATVISLTQVYALRRVASGLTLLCILNIADHILLGSHCVVTLGLHSCTQTHLCALPYNTNLNHIC